MCQNVLILSFCIPGNHYSVKIDSIYFFSSSGMQKFHHLLGWHAVGINVSHIIFLNFCVSQIQYAQPKVGKNNSIRIIIVKIIIKINITRIFIKIEYIFICIKSFLIIFLVTNQSEISFNAARESSAAWSFFLWVMYLSEQYTIKEGFSETFLSRISWVLYQSRRESNTRKHLLTALSHMSWVINHSGTNFIVERWVSKAL